MGIFTKIAIHNFVFTEVCIGSAEIVFFFLLIPRGTIRSNYLFALGR